MFHKTETKELRVGRVCNVTKECIVTLDVSTSEETLFKGAKVVILPQRGIPRSVSLDKLAKGGGYSVWVHVLYIPENIKLLRKTIDGCAFLPLNCLEGTKEMLLDVTKLGWRAIITIASTYGVSLSIVETLLALRGVKETFKIIQGCSRVDKNILLIKCPQCGSNVLFDVFRHTYCDSCHNYNVIENYSVRELIEKHKKNPLKVIEL